MALYILTNGYRTCAVLVPCCIWYVYETGMPSAKSATATKLT